MFFSTVLVILREKKIIRIDIVIQHLQMLTCGSGKCVPIVHGVRKLYIPLVLLDSKLYHLIEKQLTYIQI